ncbi:tail protein X [Hydrogenophaga sp.]|uniref:tail protein X n=1 Tax=Hydrogenophaga sp. TaxID=1904254 RepID=UPI003F6E7948
MQVRTLQGDTVDLLCHRHLGITTGGVVESTLALNPGLADAGPILPAGHLVTLAAASYITATNSTTVNLWD